MLMWRERRVCVYYSVCGTAENRGVFGVVLLFFGQPIQVFISGWSGLVGWVVVCWKQDHVKVGACVCTSKKSLAQCNHAIVRCVLVVHKSTCLFFLLGGTRWPPCLDRVFFRFSFGSWALPCICYTWFAFSGHSLRAVGVVVGPLYVGTTACAFPTKSCCVFQNVAGCGFISR